MSTVSLLLSCAAFNSNYTEAVKTLNQHVILRSKNKRFLGRSNIMLLCRSDVLSWSLQEFSLCVLITTSKRICSPECVVRAFRGISSSIVIPPQQTTWKHTKRQMPHDLLALVCHRVNQLSGVTVWFVFKQEPIFVIDDFHVLYLSRLSGGLLTYHSNKWI